MCAPLHINNEIINMCFVNVDNLLSEIEIIQEYFTEYEIIRLSLNPGEITLTD